MAFKGSIVIRKRRVTIAVALRLGGASLVIKRYLQPTCRHVYGFKGG
jgi:hypothetical protein